MIDPASIGDWAQALLMASLLGGGGAVLARALREEEPEPAVVPVPERQQVMTRDAPVGAHATALTSSATAHPSRSGVPRA